MSLVKIVMIGAVSMMCAPLSAQLQCTETRQTDCAKLSQFVEDLSGRIDPVTHSVHLSRLPSLVAPIKFFREGVEETSTKFTISNDLVSLDQSTSEAGKVMILYYSSSASPSVARHRDSAREPIVERTVKEIAQIEMDHEVELATGSRQLTLRTQQPSDTRQRAAQPRSLRMLESDLDQSASGDFRVKSTLRKHSHIAEGADGLGDNQADDALQQLEGKRPMRSYSVLPEATPVEARGQAVPAARSLRLLEQRLSTLRKRRSSDD